MTDPRTIETADAEASSFMHEGMRLMQGGKDARAALLCFDRALELRRQFPTGTPAHAYGLAACWLNRAEALTSLGPAHYTAAFGAYEEALALLHTLPTGEDARFPRRLAIALQNRALLLAGQNPPAAEDAVAALADAIEVLNHAEAMERSDREFLLAMMWMNLANVQALEDEAVSHRAAWRAAQRALELVKAQEHEDAAAAEVGLKARHVLCRIAAHRLSGAAERSEMMADVHDATDFAEEGLGLVREWERRGIGRFRNLASELLRFGALVYAEYQPQFLQEFLGEHAAHRGNGDRQRGSEGEWVCFQAGL